MQNKWKTALIAGLCAFAVLSTGFSMMTLKKIRELESKVSNVKQVMGEIDSNINSTLNTAVETITESAKQEASILSDYKIVWQECTPAGMKFKVRVYPKAFDKNTEVKIRCSGESLKDENYEQFFDTEGFEEQIVLAERAEEGIYEAEMTTPLADLLKIKVEIQNGEKTYTQKIPDYHSSWDSQLLQPQMYGGIMNTTTHANNKNSLKYEAYANISSMDYYDAGGVKDGAKLVGSEVLFFLNDQEILRKDMNEKAEVSEGEKPTSTIDENGNKYTVWSADKSGNAGKNFQWEGELNDLKEGDILRIVVRAKDNLGFTYEKEVSKLEFYIKNGWIQSRERMDSSSQIKIY